MQIADEISAINDSGFANKPSPLVQTTIVSKISGSRRVFIK